MTVAIPAPSLAAVIGTAPDPADVRMLRTALTVWLAEQAVAACPWTHHPVERRDGRTPWCVYCGRDEVGELIVDPATVRGLAP